MKNFVCVRFIRGSKSDIVCKQWMITETRCRWPQNDQNVREMVKNKVLSEENWKVFSCEILCQSNSYDRCLKKAYTTEELNDSSEDDGSTSTQIPTLQRENAIAPKRIFLSPQHPAPRKRAKVDDLTNLSNICWELNIIRTDVANVLNAVKSNKVMIEDALAYIKSLKQVEHQKETTWTAFQPASSEEELSQILNNFQDFQNIGRKIDRGMLRATVRAFMRCFMTRPLAMTYSWSGLGSQRKATKKPFSGSQLDDVLRKCLQFTSHQSASSQEVVNDIKTVLSGAADWDGGRNLRKGEKDNKTCEGADVSSDDTIKYVSSEDTDSD
uniref:Uncharacterized protein LOC108949781 n=1 Tax=Phallusia mammillata TaxID=59560 RepID=A0A6F9DII3_9ASCI|nr:uncharacterized protein LOC108949781 [Phallusia mammillata]